jgi:hypothetical protein
MNRIVASLVILASVSSVGYAFAQDEKKSDVTQEDTSASTNERHFKRGPVDLQKFSNVENLKAADANGDGTLSREEIEAEAMKRMVKRMADRMERRLDVNGDGKVTIEEVEKQKQKEFAALDRNEDGKLDRKEMRAAHKGGRHAGHGKHHRWMQHGQ